MSSMIVHAALDVRGAIKWPAKARAGLLRDGRGRPLSGNEVRDALLDALAEGCEVLPIGQPCEGFSFKTGCPGHPVNDDARGVTDV